MSKRIPWFEILLTVAFLSATFYAALSDAYNLPNRWFIRDDAYYYFKVAQNITEGRGSTFDGIHLTNGYHPLWMLICIPIFALARFDLILPLRLLAIVTGILQIATALLLYHLIRRAISRPAAMLAAVFWAFNTYVLLFLYKTGVESAIALFFIALLLDLLYALELTWRSKPVSLTRIAGLAIVAMLVVFGRLDLIFFALIVGLWIVFRGTPMRYLLPVDVLALTVAVVSAFLLRLGFAAYYDVAQTAVTMLAAALLIKIPALYLFGLYHRPANWRPLQIVGRALLATAAGSALLAALLLAGGALGLVPPLSRAILAIDAGLSLVLVLLIRIGAYALKPSKAAAPDAGPLEQLKARWKRWLVEGGVYYGVVGGALALYMLWNRLAFGTFTPVSGQIKQWWGTFTHSIYGGAATSWLTFFGLNPFSEYNAWAPPTTQVSDFTNRLLYRGDAGLGNEHWQQNFALILAAVVVILVAVLFLRRSLFVRGAVQTGMIPVFIGSWLQILGYNVLGYASPKEWYWLTQPVFLVLVGAALANVLMDVLFRRWRAMRLLLWVLVAWYGIHAAYAYWRDAVELNPYGAHAPGTPYTDVIPFLEKSTEPGSVIGMTGGGNIGYFIAGRTIVNMDGLINSHEYFVALKAGTGSDYLYDTGMRYVFANPTILDSNPYKGQYTNRLQLLVDWGGKDLLRLLPEPRP